MFHFKFFYLKLLFSISILVYLKHVWTLNETLWLTIRYDPSDDLEDIDNSRHCFPDPPCDLFVYNSFPSLGFIGIKTSLNTGTLYDTSENFPEQVMIVEGRLIRCITWSCLIISPDWPLAKLPGSSYKTTRMYDRGLKFMLIKSFFLF